MRRLAWLLLVTVTAAASAEDAVPSLASRAAALVAALPADVRGEALYELDADEREDIRFAPVLLDGAKHGELPDGAASLVDELLAVSLSARGLEKTRAIRRNELAVRTKAPWWLPDFVVERFYDPGRYFVAVFGDPAGGGPFGVRYEGHHYSMNLTAVPGAVPASTPLFLGAQPRVAPVTGAEVLGQEEAAARALLAALPAALRERATLPYEEDRGMMLGQVRRLASAGDAGVARGEAPPGAQAQYDRLVALFAGFFADEIAAARLAEIDAAGRDALRFAWAEAAEPPGAYYFRLSGPRTLIEIDNTTDGDHVHAVWHDLADDFGDDLLARHYQRSHPLALGAAR
jgi:hypothetical protein